MTGAQLFLIEPIGIIFTVGVGAVFAPQIGRALAWCDRQSSRTLGLILIRPRLGHGAVGLVVLGRGLPMSRTLHVRSCRRPGDGAIGRRQTILRIIRDEKAKTGRTPTAEDIARILGGSVLRVRQHLEAIEQETNPQRSLL
jgi:hypothetical protein